MLIVCPNCKKRFDVILASTDEPKKLRCSSCKAVFRVVRKVERPVAPQGKVKVVVANESAAFCKAVEKVVAAEPFELFLCTDGKEALETVQRVQPDVLLLDVALPTMFGFEVCERVRQDPALAKVKIVLIASIYDKTRYKRSPNSLYGADDYIEKHHIPDSLVAMIYRLTSGGALPAVAGPSETELAAQEESRSTIRQCEVEETSMPAAPSMEPAAPQAQPAAAAPVAQPVEPVVQQPVAALAEAAPVEAPATAAAPVAPAPVVEAPAPAAEPEPEVPAPAAPAPAPAAQPAAAEQLPEEQVKARRLARIIVSDIVLYNQAKVEQGVREGNFYELLADDIREGEYLYQQRVSQQVRDTTSFLKHAFEELIAKKRTELHI